MATTCGFPAIFHIVRNAAGEIQLKCWAAMNDRVVIRDGLSVGSSGQQARVGRDEFTAVVRVVYAAYFL